MKDQNKTKKQLTDELIELRQRLTEFEALEKKGKQTEEELQQNERRYRPLVENMYDLVSEVDPDGRLAYLSPNDKETVGYDPGEYGARRGAISWEQKARALIPGL